MAAGMTDKDLVDGLRKRSANPLVDPSTSQYLALAADRLDALAAGPKRRRRNYPRDRAKPGTRQRSQPAPPADNWDSMDDTPDWDDLTSPLD